MTHAICWGVLVLVLLKSDCEYMIVLPLYTHSPQRSKTTRLKYRHAQKAWSRKIGKRGQVQEDRIRTTGKGGQDKEDSSRKTKSGGEG